MKTEDKITDKVNCFLTELEVLCIKYNIAIVPAAIFEKLELIDYDCEQFQFVKEADINITL